MARGPVGAKIQTLLSNDIRASNYRSQLLIQGCLMLLLTTAGCVESYEVPRESRCETVVPPGGAAGAENEGYAGASGAAGAGGSAGEAPTDGTGPPPPSTPGGSIESNDFVSNIEITPHPQVKTVLLVRWTQTKAAEQTWLEFGLEGEPPMFSRPGSGELGPQSAVVLGMPADSDVALRIVSKSSDIGYKTSPESSRTGALPKSMPLPQVLSYDARLASPKRFLFGAVEDSVGGSRHGYYLQTFWLYIIDRKGRVVWYYADPGSNATSSFQRVARDGEYIVFERRCYSCQGYAESVVKLTLDHELFEEIPTPGLSDSIDVTADGSLLYDTNPELVEMTKDGQRRVLWSCALHFGPGFPCYSNTVNYDPAKDSILLSYPYARTVVEVARDSGKVLGQYGSARGSFSFAPPLSQPPKSWNFGFQHFPNFTPQGTLLVSSHMPGCENTNHPVRYQHAFVEFEVDRERRELIETWRYTEGPEWPTAKGMAIRLDNGNTLANYGTGGVIREITPSRQTAWLVKFDVPEGDDFYNKMVGHNVLVDDLYALNGGLPPN